MDKSGYGVHFPPGIRNDFTHFVKESVGPLYFAGSETATEWRLYMEGAVESGQRAAQQVIESLKG